MERQSNILENLIDRTESYVASTFELSKLKMLEKLIVVVSSTVANLSTIIVLSISLLLFSIASSLYLGKIFEDNYLGFLIIAGVYLVFGLICHYFLRSRIKCKVSEAIIYEATKP